MGGKRIGKKNGHKVYEEAPEFLLEGTSKGKKRKMRSLSGNRSKT